LLDELNGSQRLLPCGKSKTSLREKAADCVLLRNTSNNVMSGIEPVAAAELEGWLSQPSVLRRILCL
jgi:hypothetical protein